MEVQARNNYNKAVCALANKLARICYATLRDREPFVSIGASVTQIACRHRTYTIPT